MAQHNKYRIVFAHRIGCGVSGSTAYHDLRATDNPYDPRFSAGVVTVGEVKGVDPKKPEEKADDKPPEKP